jgi:hypothetical protein
VSLFGEDPSWEKPPLVGAMVHLATPTYPDFRFEWHPGKKIVYHARLTSRPVIAEAIAHAVETHGAAYNVVLIWLRGYRAAKAEFEEGPWRFKTSQS